MKLDFKKLEYKNIKVTEHRIVDLSGTGLTMVIGPNGGGKSTIADALKVALFDRTLDKKAGNTILSRNKKSGWVKVWFTENAHTFCIENILSQNKSLLNVYKDDLQLNGENGYLSGKTAVKSFVKKYFTENIFNNVLYFSSNRSRSGFFLDLSEPDQKRFLEEVLPNFLLYRKAEEIAKETLSSIKIELLKTENECSIVEKELVLRKENLDKESISIDEFEKSLKAKHQKVHEDIQKIVEWLNVANDAQNKIAKLRKEYAKKEESCKKIVETREQLEKSLKELEEKIVVEFHEKRNALIAENTSLHKEEAEANEKLKNKLKIIREIYDKEVEELNAELKTSVDELNASLTSVNEMLIEYEVSCKKLENDRKALNKEIEEISKTIENKNSICPICKNAIKNFDELKKVLKEKEQALSTKTEEFQKVHQKRLKLTERKSSIINKIEETTRFNKEQLEELKVKKAEYEQQLDTHFAEFKKDLQKRFSIVDIKLKGLESAQKKLLDEHIDRLRLLKQLKSAFESEEAAYKVLSTSREELLKLESAYSNAQIVDRKKDIENLNSLIVSDQKELEKRKSQQKENIDKYFELEKSRKQEVLKKQKDAQSNSEAYEYLTKVFSHNGIRSWYLDLVIPSFNAILRKNCSSIAPNFRVSLVRDGSDVKLVCKNFINGSDFDGFSSGERSLISLVVILSISELLSSYEQFSSNIVIFDEVFDSLDRKNSMIVLDALYLLSQKKKVILLTHNESYKNSELADEVIEVQ